MIILKAASPLDKFFLTDSIENVETPNFTPVFPGETFAFHAVYTAPDAQYLKEKCRAVLESDVGESKLYSVEHVPVRTTHYPDSYDDNYISYTPGLFPDVMNEISGQDHLYAPQTGVNMLRAEIKIPEDTKSGSYSASLMVISEETGKETAVTVRINVLPEILPKQKTVVMQWLHADCIAERYGLEALSDTHFEYIKKYVRRAVENGINALLTPVFTPPLDTEIGGERLTVQLVGVNITDGKISFDYTLLDRWIDMAIDCGVEYFEIAHLFTQWGAHHAPKIIANKDGETVRLFGWETDALSDEYVSFIRQFLTELIAHMKSRGLDKKCIFHISDEPSEKDAESYRNAVASVRDVLDGYIVADALSDVSYYEDGTCRCPIPSTDHAKKFLKEIPEGLWVYYCCSQSVNVSNRFIAMSLARTRIIGLQMWKYKAAGFLHWGYNFYNSQHSRYKVDPYICTDADYFAPAGDAFSVYPGDGGDAVPSLRLRAFYEALCDIRALEAVENRFGRDAALACLMEEKYGELTFESYSKNGDYILKVREKIGNMLQNR